MATSTLASSLILSSLNPKPTQSFLTTTSRPLPFISISSISLKLQAKPFSPLHFHPLHHTSRFLRHVAVSSEFDQEEELLSGDDGEEEPNLSPELKLFVGNLPFSVDSAQLAGLFQNAGTVEMVEVIYDKVTRRSRGFGFVTMSTIEEVESAVQQFNGYEFEGRALRVRSGPPPQGKPSFRGSRNGSTNRLHVGNLSWGVDNMALETLFSEQGNVLDAKVIYDRESGRSRGFGFVTYGSAEEADNAVESLNGVELDGRAIRVSVAEERPRRQY